MLCDHSLCENTGSKSQRRMPAEKAMGGEHSGITGTTLCTVDDDALPRFCTVGVIFQICSLRVMCFFLRLMCL